MEEFARVLVLETSGKVGQVAVARDGGLAGFRVLPEARRHARDLAVHTSQLLAEQGWRARDLTAIIAGIGPGSYTGLRVAVASAKALAYATGAALFGVPSFDAIAVGTAYDGSTLEIIADAQQNQVYCQRLPPAVDKAAEVRESASRIVIRPIEQWLQELLPGSMISGPAAAMYASRLPATVHLAKEEEREARAEHLLGAVMANPGRYRSNAWGLEPIYLRGSSAEEKRKRQG